MYRLSIINSDVTDADADSPVGRVPTPSRNPWEAVQGDTCVIQSAQLGNEVVTQSTHRYGAVCILCDSWRCNVGRWVKTFAKSTHSTLRNTYPKYTLSKVPHTCMFNVVSASGPQYHCCAVCHCAFCV